MARAFGAQVAAEGFTPLPVTLDHAALACSLDIAHKGPFDRLLVAQARLERVALVSNEALFDGFWGGATMVGNTLSIGLLLALAAPPPDVTAQVPAGVPVSTVTFVGMSSKRCVFMTGDVLFDARGFREDLSHRFSRANGIIIYYGKGVRRSCLADAQRVIRRLGFRITRIEEAPKDLDMGPPR